MQEIVVLTKSRLVAMSLGPTAAPHIQEHILMRIIVFTSLEHLKVKSCECSGKCCTESVSFEQLSNLENLKEGAVQKRRARGVH